MNPRDRQERERRDDQPDRPYAHAGGTRPVAPSREYVSPCVLELELPTDEECSVGKAAIAEARARLESKKQHQGTVPDAGAVRAEAP